jgi:hypothetical protein
MSKNKGATMDIEEEREYRHEPQREAVKTRQACEDHTPKTNATRKQISYGT